MNLIFLGPPGAGKGTQASRVAQELNIRHISTGNMLREAIAAKSDLGLQVKEIIERGDLVPDALIVSVVRECLEQSDCAPGVLLDGFPRTIQQAEALSGFAKIDAVVNIDVPEAEVVERISGRRMCRACGESRHYSQVPDGRCPLCGGEMYQRADDEAETVRNRMRVYEVQTAPLIAYYQQQGNLLDIQGNQSVEDVFAQIIDALKGL